MSGGSAIETAVATVPERPAPNIVREMGQP
jgi:hypothetical protein